MLLSSVSCSRTEPPTIARDACFFPTSPWIPARVGVSLRGEFPNPDAELLPGMYVRIQIEEAIDAQAITVPAQAVQRNNAGGSEVYVVNDESRAVLQPVRTGRLQADQVLIEDLVKLQL
jgi:membrane fusion protein, multidrug efflux system